MIQPPAQLARLIAAAGEEAVLRLVEGHGGQRLWVPSSAAGSQLEGLYGAEVARLLSAEFGGEEIKVPMARAWRAACYRRAGLTVGEIGRHLGVDRSTIQRLLKAHGGSAAEPVADAGATRDAVQLDMFSR